MEQVLQRNNRNLLPVLATGRPGHSTHSYSLSPGTPVSEALASKREVQAVAALRDDPAERRRAAEEHARAGQPGVAVEALEQAIEVGHPHRRARAQAGDDVALVLGAH